MARFSVYRVRGTYVVDCQADLLSHLGTHVVAPLLPPADIRFSVQRLHPSFEVSGQTYVLATHLLSIVPARELGNPVLDLRERQDEIMAALDMLLIGY